MNVPVSNDGGFPRPAERDAERAVREDEADTAKTFAELAWEVD